MLLKWESNEVVIRLHFIMLQKRVLELLQQLHNGSDGGHLGINETLVSVRERYYWLGNKVDTRTTFSI